MSLDKNKSCKISRRELFPWLVVTVSVCASVCYLLNEHNKSSAERVNEAKMMFSKELLKFGIIEENTVDNILSSIVAILDKENKIMATGFFIGNNIISTAGHVLDRDRMDCIMDLEGTVYNINQKYRDIDDIGIVETDKHGKGYLNIFSTNRAKSGKRITLGFGWERKHVTTGKSIERDSLQEGKEGSPQVGFLSNDPIKGDSGAPVFDENGNVIGMIVRSSGNGSVFEPVEDIISFLNNK